MKQLGEEVSFTYSGFPVRGTVVSVTDDPGLARIEYVVQCNKFLGARFHFNTDDQIIWVENMLQ